MSISWPSDVEPAPAILVLPPAAASLDEAHAAIELWEHYSGKTLDPSQRLTVQVMMAQRTDGVWAAQTTGREMARQNGKGDEAEVVELWGLVQRAEAILHTIHDAVLLATETQQRMIGVLESHPDLRRKVKRKWTGTGQQMIEMRNGGVIWYRTRTGAGGRGVDNIDRLVVDEAQHATSEQLAAMTPTLLVNPNPQLNVIGTAGLPNRSEWWWTIRKRALSDDPGAFGYVGHTAEMVSLDVDGRVEQQAPDASDRSTWWAANPALHAGRGQGIDFLEENYRNLGPVMFAQEHLCVWAPPADGTSSGPIDPAHFASLADITVLPDPSDVSLALDVTPDLGWATLAAAGWRPDGFGFVTVVDTRPGTAWVVDRCATASENAGGRAITVVRGTPAAAFVDDLMAAGVPVDVMTPPQFAESTGRFIEAAKSSRLRHDGNPRLLGALRVAVAKESGDGAVAWSRRTSTADITQIAAATAAWGRVNEKSEEGYSWTVY